MAVYVVHAPEGPMWETIYRSKKVDALRALLAKLDEEAEEAEEKDDAPD